MYKTKKKGKNLHDVKEDNRFLVLKMICTGQCTSRMEISKKTGLTKMTVTNILQDLLKNKLVCEGPLSVTSSVGRRPVSLYPNDKGKRAVGVYISRDGIIISLLSISAKILNTEKIALGKDDTSVTLISKILIGINHILQSEKRARILGIGVACIGPLDIQNGIISSPIDFHGIENVALKQLLEEATSLPVIVNNDMNAAALAEQLYGNGVGADHFLYFGLTHGVGAGIVANGKLYSGSQGYGGELGHVSIRYDGPICTCGNHGCVELYASMPVFLKKAKYESEMKKDSALSAIKDPGFSDVALFAERGDALAVELMEELCFMVSTALINSIHLLNPSKVFIGHESAQGGDWFAGQIEKQLNGRCLFRKNSAIKVQISKFGDHSSIVGSGVLVFDQYFQGNLAYKSELS